MKISKIIGAILILLSLGVGYLGINKVDENTSSVNFLGIKMDFSDKSGSQEGYVYIGIAVVLLVGGIYTLKKSRT